MNENHREIMSITLTIGIVIFSLFIIYLSGRFNYIITSKLDGKITHYRNAIIHQLFTKYE
jgi:hypothetical protein